MRRSSATTESGILTIAHGPPVYIEMAKALARSLDRFSPGIAKAIVTDVTDGTLSSYFDIQIPYDPGRGGDVRQKLFLDCYTPFKRTFFIDSDCLVLGPLDNAFRVFAGGESIVSDRTWELSASNPHHGTDFDQLLNRTGLHSYPGFNGGLYYIEKGTRSEEVFNKGREILKDYESYGLCEFRAGQGCPGDEPVLGIAMALLKCDTVPTDQVLIGSPFGLKGKFHLDVIQGEASFVHYHGRLSPVIIHFGRWFCGESQVQTAYERECRKLEILERVPVGARFCARLYGVWHQIKIPCSAAVAALWARVPRPLRLMWHAARSRLKNALSSESEEREGDSRG